MKKNNVNNSEVFISLVAIKNTENNTKHLNIKNWLNIASIFLGKSIDKYLPPIFVNSNIQPENILLFDKFNNNVSIIYTKQSFNFY